jgi:hypothetical protein
MTGANTLWIQRQHEFMIPKLETVKSTTYLPIVYPFQQSLQYNNWGCGMATEVIEYVSLITKVRE